MTSRVFFHGGRDRMIGPDPDAAEEAGEHDFVAGIIARAHLHPVVGHDPENVTQIEEPPPIAAENA
jgi:hypothetical protein